MNYYEAQRMIKHIQALRKLFPRCSETDTQVMWSRLKLLEARGHALGLRMCNGPAFESEEESEELGDRILQRLDEILGYKKSKIPVFLNLDPRGCALKIDSEWVGKSAKVAGLARDMGGYVTLVPEFK